MKKNKAEKWRSYEEDFKAVCKDYNLMGLTKDETTKRMIEICDDLQGQICNESDEIKISGLARANSILNKNVQSEEETVEMTKGNWNEMVALGARSKTAKTQKLIEKIDSGIAAKNATNDMIGSLRTNIENGNDADISLPEKLEFGVQKTVQNDELSEVYKECVEKREYINKTLYKEYYRVSRAFQFLHEGQLNADDFKMLVDDVHYKDGGYPSETTPPRTWSKINSSYKLIRAMIIAGKEEYIRKYMKDNFGMEVTVMPSLERYEWTQKDEE